MAETIPSSAHQTTARDGNPNQPVSQFINKLLLYLGVFLVIGVILAGVTFVTVNRLRIRKEEERAAFEQSLAAQIPRYIRSYPPYNTDRYPEPPKILVIDVDNQKVDESFYELPAELRISTPDEIQWLVQVRRSSELTGFYQGTGLAASKHYAELTFVDLPRKKTVSVQRLEQDPPEEIKLDMFGFPSEPVDQPIANEKIADWILHWAWKNH